MIYPSHDLGGTDSAKDTGQKSDSMPALRVEKEFDVWGRKWIVICTPEAGSSQWASGVMPSGAILFSLLLLTGLVIAFVSFLQRARKASMQLAETRLKGRHDLETQVKAREASLEALGNALEMVETVIGSAPVAIAFMKNHVILWSNEAFKEITGHSREDVHGLNMRSLYETDSEFQRVNDAVYPVIASSGLAETETCFFRKDGSSVDVSLSLVPVDRSDLSAGIVFAAMDISERKKSEKVICDNTLRMQYAERERTEIFQRLELALRGADLGVWDWHVQSGDLFQDEIWHAQLGYSMNDVERNIASWENRIHPDDRPVVLKALNDCLEGSSPFYSVEHRLLTKSGDWKWILTRGKVLERDEQGRPVRMLGTHLDIDKARTTDEALQKSEKMFRVLIETIEDVFWVSDPSIQNILLASPAYEKVWGKPLQDLYEVPRQFLESVHPEDKNRFMEYFEKFHTQGTGYSLEYRIIRPDGSIRWIFERAYPIHDSKGNLELMCGVSTDITDRKNAEKEYTKFKTISDKSNSGNAIADLNGNIVYLNDSFASMHGYSISECLGRNLSMFHTEEQMPAIRESMATLVDRGSFETFELWHKHRDETVFPTLMNGALIPDDSGNPLFLSTTVIDITEQKKAEQSLHDSEELFRNLFYFAPDSMAISRIEDGKYINVNRRFTELTGFTVEEILGRTSLDVGLWLKPQDFKYLYEEIARTGKLDNFEVQFRLKDGRIKTGLLSATLLELNQIPHLLGVVKDIDDIKKTQAQYARLATAVDQAAERVVVTDPDGSIVYVNPAFERSTGYSREEVIGQYPSIISSGQHDKSFFKDMWHTISSGNVWRGRIMNKRKDGRLLLEQSTITPVKDSAGTIINYVQIASDITAEENLRDQLSHSQKMEAIGTLASGIAHDFNNIIQAIMGYTELVMDDMPVESRAYANLEKVMGAAQRSGEMVRQILTFSRRSKSNVSIIDIAPLIKEGLKFLRAAIPANIEIKDDIRTNIGKILGDPTQVHQVLMNLCVNAAQAMELNKGVVLIELEQVDLDADFAGCNPPLTPGKHLRLRVSDTGCGIPSEILDKIFDPYFTTKDLHGGTGLGLSVVHGIVSGCNGAITVDSELGKGTIFSVYFPTVEERIKVDTHDQILGNRPLGSEHVIVVDDEDVLVELVASQLQRLGYKVSTTMDPREALRLLMQYPDKFDVVVTDLMMPQMSGVELAEKIAPAWPNLPVILCTGWNEAISNEQIRKAGIKAVVSKPATKDEIAHAIRKVIDETKS